MLRHATTMNNFFNSNSIRLAIRSSLAFHRSISQAVNFSSQITAVKIWEAQTKLFSGPLVVSKMSDVTGLILRDVVGRDFFNENLGISSKPLPPLNIRNSSSRPAKKELFKLTGTKMETDALGIPTWNSAAAPWAKVNTLASTGQQTSGSIGLIFFNSTILNHPLFGKLWWYFHTQKDYSTNLWAIKPAFLLSAPSTTVISYTWRVFGWSWQWQLHNTTQGAPALSSCMLLMALLSFFQIFFHIGSCPSNGGLVMFFQQASPAAVSGMEHKKQNTLETRKRFCS